MALVAPHLQEVAGAASRPKTLDLEGALEVDGDAEAMRHHDVPAAVHTPRVVLWVARAAQNTTVRMQEATATCRNQETQRCTSVL